MKRFFIIFFSMAINFTVYADDESERAALSNLVKEIDFIILKINEIEKSAPDKTRIKFNYSALSGDLKNIRTGISDHIQGNINTGRIIQPIKHHYR